MNEKVNEMEYVYAAMLLHSAGKDIDDKAVGSVLKAAGVEADGARVKALVASLGSVDIDEAMATAVAAPVASAAPSASSGSPAEAPLPTGRILTALSNRMSSISPPSHLQHYQHHPRPSL